MLRNLGAFDKEPGKWWGREMVAEQDFELALSDSLVIRGRIDRLDLLPDGRALVVDYKYSSSSRMREIISGNEEGNKVQAGLYLLAARRAFGYDPAGVLFCTLRQEVTWDGWHAPVEGLEKVGEVCAPEVLAELMEGAVARSQDAARQIYEGRVEPAPAEASLCRNCDFRDICRVDEQERVVLAGGGGA
jgi:ATP-dependent helicase/nuclease subunit B